MSGRSSVSLLMPFPETTHNQRLLSLAFCQLTLDRMQERVNALLHSVNSPLSPLNGMQAFCQQKSRVAYHPALALLLRLNGAQRIGGAYCTPPLLHNLLRPRPILSCQPGPTFVSKFPP